MVKKKVNSFCSRTDNFSIKREDLNPVVCQWKRRFKLTPVEETGEYVEKEEIYKYDEFDLYKKIQAEAVGTSIYEILDRVLMTPEIYADDGKSGMDLSMIGPSDDMISLSSKLTNIDTSGLDKALQRIDPVVLASMTDSEIINIVRNYYSNLNSSGGKNNEAE